MIKKLLDLQQIIFVEFGIRRDRQFLQTCPLLDCTLDQKMQTEVVLNSKYDLTLWRLTTNIVVVPHR